ncbi:hypothetical protein [Flavobacterium sp. H4147]|uniref:hypothetical protein n=1 Tax=Flavobacterium sp. H4147 TaxID=3034149 RepID=UPI0023ED2A31|nr:hypothetical protein [Flavobacterium sp. H4147]
MKPCLLLFLVFFISCEIKSDQPLPVQDNNTLVSQKHLKPAVKYVFAVFEVKEPHLMYVPPQYIDDKLFEETAVTEWKNQTYCSEIKEFENFTDKQGKELLLELLEQIPNTPSEYLNDIIRQVKNPSSIEVLSKQTTKIISDKYLEFDNLSEAVTEREKIIKDGN